MPCGCFGASHLLMNRSADVGHEHQDAVQCWSRSLNASDLESVAKCKTLYASQPAKSSAHLVKDRCGRCALSTVATRLQRKDRRLASFSSVRSFSDPAQVTHSVHAGEYPGLPQFHSHSVCHKHGLELACPHSLYSTACTAPSLHLAAGPLSTANPNAAVVANRTDLDTACPSGPAKPGARPTSSRPGPFANVSAQLFNKCSTVLHRTVPFVPTRTVQSICRVCQPCGPCPMLCREPIAPYMMQVTSFENRSVGSGPACGRYSM